MTDIKEATGAELRAEREKAGIDLQDMALALQMSISVLSRTETGFRPVDSGLSERYLNEVQRIALQRAIAVGAVPAEVAAA